MLTKHKLNVDDALRIIRSKCPGTRIYSLVECEEYYVFGVEPEELEPDPNREHIGGGSKLNRFTGEITGFLPHRDGWEHFKNGKQIIP